MGSLQVSDVSPILGTLESPRNIPKSETASLVSLALFHAMHSWLSWPCLPIGLPSRIITVSSHLVPLLCPLTVHHFWHSNFIVIFTKSPWSMAVSGLRPMKLQRTPAWKGPSLGSGLRHCILKPLMIFEPIIYPYCCFLVGARSVEWVSLML